MKTVRTTSKKLISLALAGTLAFAMLPEVSQANAKESGLSQATNEQSFSNATMPNNDYALDSACEGATLDTLNASNLGQSVTNSGSEAACETSSQASDAQGESVNSNITLGSSDVEYSGYCGADDGGTNISWTYDGAGTLTLTGSGETKFYNESNSWMGFSSPVPGWYTYRESITKVVIGEGITKLNSALLAHTSITSITLPSTIKELSQLVFKDCSKLANVQLNEGLETIGTSCFSGTALTQLSIPSTVSSISYNIRDVLSLDKINISANNNNIKKVDNILYSTDMKTLFWADKTFNGAFTIPNSVNTIGESAFEEISLTAITIPSSVTKIGAGAFNITNITTVTIPSSVTEIGRSAFSNCAQLKTATIAPCTAKIDNSLFAFCTSLESVEIGEGLTSLGERAFGGCTSLKSVTLPSTITSVDENTFNKCTSLASVKFLGNTTTLGYAAFANCTALTAIELPQALTTIGEGCFNNTGLLEVNVPSSVESIGKNAFPDTTNVVLPSGLVKQSDGSYVSDKGLTTFSVPVTLHQSEARKLIDSVNSFRTGSDAWYWSSDDTTKTYANGLSTLQYDADLEQAAIQRAKELVLSFSHTRPDGTNCFTAVDSSFSAKGENIAWGYGSAESVLEGWKETNEQYSGQGHRRNMLSSSFNCAGYACVEYNGRYFWVQEFGFKQSPNTEISAADDSAQNAKFTYNNSVIQAVSDLNYANTLPLAQAGQSATIPDVTGKVKIADSTLSVTFNTTWKSSNERQIQVSGNTVTALVNNNSAYIYSYINGEMLTINTYSGEYVFPNIYGETSAETSAKIALEAYPSGCSTVVIARDDDFADAMSATGLAGTLGAPIVLTSASGLSNCTSSAIQKLGANVAYIIGGKGALSLNLESELSEIGCKTEERVYGTEAWDTSVECARLIADLGGNEQSEAIVAMSTNFQDALSMSSYAYKYHVPILLETSTDRELTYGAKRVIKSTKGTIYVPGGTGAVPASSVEDVFTTRTVQRLAGDDGYDTSNQIATYMVANNKLSASTVCLVNGAPSPKGTDALAGSALAGIKGGVILLTNANASFGDAENYTTIDGIDSKNASGFLKANATNVENAYVLGGPVVMPKTICQRIEQYVSIARASAN